MTKTHDAHVGSDPINPHQIDRMDARRKAIEEHLKKLENGPIKHQLDAFYKWATLHCHELDKVTRYKEKHKNYDESWSHANEMSEKQLPTYWSIMINTVQVIFAVGGPVLAALFPPLKMAEQIGAAGSQAMSFWDRGNQSSKDSVITVIGQKQRMSQMKVENHPNAMESSKQKVSRTLNDAKEADEAFHRMFDKTSSTQS